MPGILGPLAQRSSWRSADERGLLADRHGSAGQIGRESLDDHEGGKPVSGSETVSDRGLEQARLTVKRADALRAIATAMDAGYPAEDVARRHADSQRQAESLIRMAVAQRDLWEVTPFEVISRATLGQMSRAEMMSRLLRHAYTRSRHDPTGGDGYIRGTWNQVERAVGLGLLTDDEYEMVARRALSL
jgi:hypothetical protein